MLLKLAMAEVTTLDQPLIGGTSKSAPRRQHFHIYLFRYIGFVIFRLRHYFAFQSPWLLREYQNFVFKLKHLLGLCTKLLLFK